MIHLAKAFACVGVLIFFGSFFFKPRNIGPWRKVGLPRNIHFLGIVLMLLSSGIQLIQAWQF